MNTETACNAEADTQEATRTLHQIRSIDEWPKNTDQTPAMTIAVLDTETDGLDPTCDNILQIAVAMIEVDAIGRILRVIDHGTAMQDPKRQIPPKIVALTGIDNRTVKGKRIKRDALTAFLCKADALLAHNAGFDAGFVRRLLPGIAHLPWICSMRDVAWAKHGYDGAKLGHLLMQSGMFAEAAHDAMADVEALLSLLASELPTGETVLAEAITTARTPTVRIDAVDAPYSVKGELKRFGYRFDWNPQRKVWWKEVSLADNHAELAWLLRTAPNARPTQQTLTWHDRHG